MLRIPLPGTAARIYWKHQLNIEPQFLLVFLRHFATFNGIVIQAKATLCIGLNFPANMRQPQNDKFCFLAKYQTRQSRRNAAAAC